MREQLSALTQSRFYSPAFNGAIFDGPIRIYFSQNQESSAMKLYFAVLARMRATFGDLRGSHQDGAANIFVLIYPTKESFSLVFPSDSRLKIQQEKLDEDYIVGICCPMDESEFPSFFTVLDGILSQLPLQASIAPL
jgi:hypothetical protein